jgi:hypothetical protein
LIPRPDRQKALESDAQGNAGYERHTSIKETFAMIFRGSRFGGLTAIILLAVFVTLLTQVDASAIPAFARKYETSCTTCHVIYPKLNSYGEGFRNSGYRFVGNDEELVKQADIPMGADAWKHVFPHGTWPGALPRYVPLAIRGAFGAAYWPDDDLRKSSFQTPWEASILWGTTLGEKISTYGKVNLDGGSLDRAFVRFNSILGNTLGENSFNIKLGKLEPTTVPYSLTRFVGISVPLLYGINRSQGDFTYGMRQRGMEIDGIIGHHFKYSVGASNGSNGFRDDNNTKDIFGRISYKIGGIGIDGYSKVLEEGGELPQTDNWTDNSFTLGLSAYDGVETINDEVDNDVKRLALDARLMLGSLDLFGIYIDEEDSDPFGQNELWESSTWFVQADYVFLPWMIGYLRYEDLEKGIDIRDSEPEDLQRWVPGLTLAIRANVRIAFEAQLYQDDYNGDVYQAVIDLAF